MNNFLKFSLSLTIIVLVATSGLSKVYTLTRAKIEEQQRRKIEEALKRAVPEAKTFIVVDPRQSSADSFWVGQGANNEIEGFAILCAQRGYSSEILCMMGIDTSGKISNLEVLSQQETPGLGTRVEEVSSSATLWRPFADKGSAGPPWFQNQFKGLDATKPVGVARGLEWHKMSKTEKNELLNKNEIAALTGATISTQTIVKAISGKTESMLAYHRQKTEEAVEKTRDGE